MLVELSSTVDDSAIDAPVSTYTRRLVTATVVPETLNARDARAAEPADTKKDPTLKAVTVAPEIEATAGSLLAKVTKEVTSAPATLARPVPPKLAMARSVAPWKLHGETRCSVATDDCSAKDVGYQTRNATATEKAPKLAVTVVAAAPRLCEALRLTVHPEAETEALITSSWSEAAQLSAATAASGGETRGVPYTLITIMLSVTVELVKGAVLARSDVREAA